MNLSAHKIKIDDFLIRWMIRPDMPQVVDIIRRSFKIPPSEDEIVNYLSQRNIVAQILKTKSSVKKLVGFLMYELFPCSIGIVYLAIHPDYRRCGLGAKMVDKLISKLHPTGRKIEIFVDVRETNLPTQLFFKKMKFKAVLVDKNYFFDTGEDSYLMVYSSGAKIKKQINRISHFEK